MTQTAKSLDGKMLTFIEHVSLVISERGIPRSTGKVLGLLLICEPTYIPAEIIQMQLKLSAGSVSSALQLLQKIGLVTKTTFPEDRRFYYELAPDCWQKMIDTSKQTISRGISLADEGLEISKNNDRLKGMRRLYQMSEEMLDKIKL